MSKTPKIITWVHITTAHCPGNAHGILLVFGKRCASRAVATRALLTEAPNDLSSHISERISTRAHP